MTLDLKLGTELSIQAQLNGSPLRLYYLWFIFDSYTADYQHLKNKKIPNNYLLLFYSFCSFMAQPPPLANVSSKTVLLVTVRLSMW
jgi:hypothetical protein